MFMAEGPPSESGDAAVRNFIEMVALGFVLEAIAAFDRGESAERVIGGLAAGAAMSIAGFNWTKIKVRMDPRFTRVATNVATDFRWWLAGAFILFIYLGAPSFIRVARVSLQRPISAARAPALVALVPSDQASAEVHPPNDHEPIPNDAVKWRLAQHLHDDFAKIPAQARSCQMVIVHYQSEYSEDLTQTLGNILKFAGCDVRDFYSETMLPNGITLSLAQNTPEPLKSYLVRIKERLEGDAGIVALDDPNLTPVFHVPAQRPIAASGLYGEIIVGNEPRTAN
jgi:hypothetical protein